MGGISPRRPGSRRISTPRWRRDYWRRPSSSRTSFGALMVKRRSDRKWTCRSPRRPRTSWRDSWAARSDVARPQAAWGEVTIDCGDAERVAAFWAALLDCPAEPGEEGWVPPRPDGARRAEDQLPARSRGQGREGARAPRHLGR